jgi:hypothetical protein
VVGDVEVEDFTAIVPEDDEDEEQAKREGRDEEEVDGNNISGMRSEKSAPGGRRPRRRPVHVLGDGQLSDLVAKESQLRPDAPAAPRRILSCHPADQVAHLGVELRRPTRCGLDFQRQ